MLNKRLGKIVGGLLFTVSVFVSPWALAADKSDMPHYIIGADVTFPPFEAEVDGKVTGFDVDMLEGIAQAEGFTYEIRAMPFAGLIPSLQSGSVDAAVAGMSILESRMKRVYFSNAYYRSGLSLVVMKDSDIKDFSDLEGRVIGSKKASSSIDYLKAHGIKGRQIKQFANINDAYQALATGGVDAAFFDNPPNLLFSLKNDKVKVLDKLYNGQYYGIMISKKHPKLVKTFNDGLAQIKQDGLYEKLFDKYFGGDKRAMVMDVVPPESVAVPEKKE